MQNKRVTAAINELRQAAGHGELLLEYLHESDHQGWEGFASRDLTGVGKFLEDFVLYCKIVKANRRNGNGSSSESGNGSGSPS